jgi:hypothetical protein
MASPVRYWNLCRSCAWLPLRPRRVCPPHPEPLELEASRLCSALRSEYREWMCLENQLESDNMQMTQEFVPPTSVLRTHSSKGRTSSSEKRRNRYLRVSLSQKVSMRSSFSTGRASTSNIDAKPPVLTLQCVRNASKICHPHSLSRCFSEHFASQSGKDFSPVLLVVRNPPSQEQALHSLRSEWSPKMRIRDWLGLQTRVVYLSMFRASIGVALMIRVSSLCFRIMQERSKRRTQIAL